MSSAQDDVFVLPTSLGQERFWGLDRLNPGNPTWNLPVRFRLQGALDPALVERAFDEIVRRHEALRTTFAVVDGQAVQMIAPSLKITVAVTDLRHLPQPGRDAEVDRLSVEEALRHFDLTIPPLFRVGLLRVEDNDYVLMVTPHHSLADYWSIGLISNELGALYEAYSRGLDSPLPELPIQYGDFAVWQREQSAGEVVQKELAYWREQLKNLPLLEFPTDRPRPAFPTYNATITSILLPVTLTGAIRDIADRAGATFFNTMLAALSIVLNQYTGQTDFGVATQVAGRTSVELESLIGLFINTVVLRPNLAGDPTFLQLLSRVNEAGLQSIANQNVRFEQLLRELRPKDHPSHHTLFRVNFICQRDPVKPLEFSGIKLTVIPSKSQGALYDLNVFLVLRNEGWRLACEYNTDLFDAATITQLLANYRTLLESIAGNPDRRISEFPRLDVPQMPVAPAPEAEEAGSQSDNTYAFPITIGQQRFWLLDQLMPGNPALNLQAALRLKGSLNVSILNRSLNELIRRHEMLRTTFTSLDGQPVQVIHPPFEVAARLVDLQDLSESEREPKAKRLLAEEGRQPFVLSRAPLLRATLLQLAADHHLLMITMPHIICDGWSDGILIRELTALYEAYSQAVPSPLPEPTIHYADFAHWQSEWLKSAAFEEDLAYWKQQLQGRLPLLDLPTDRPVQAGLVSRAETETVSVPRELVGTLKEFCKREEITMFMLFLAVFKSMLHRYTGQEDILVGSPVAGRTTETEGVIGLFSYPISLRTALSEDPTFRELVSRVRDVTLGALAHKDLPFGRLVEELKVEQVQGRNPLFQVYFLHQVAFLQSVETPGLSWMPLTWVSPGTAFDLHLATLERAGEVVGRLEYNPEMFDASTIRRMLGHFRSIVDAIVSNPELRVSELPLLTPSELQLVSRPTPDRAADYPGDGFIHQIVEAQACRTPNAVAALFEGEKLTYADLDSRATRLASRLRGMGVGPETLVGVCCDSSGDMMIAMLSALKAGGAYLRLPLDRTARDLDSVKVVVTGQRHASRFLSKGMQVVYLEAASQPANDPGPGQIDAGWLACAQFTSGSTGEPKVALITHQALLARAWSAASTYGLTAGDRVAMAGLDASELILAALIRGAAVVFAPAKTLDSAAGFLRFVAKQKCGVLLLSTRFWQQLVFRCEGRKESFPSCIRVVAVHGERPAAAALAAFRRLAGVRVRCVNAYGTAETGSTASVYGPRDAKQPVSLGVPAAGFEIHLLDRYLKPVPIGVTAEICIQGAGLARGYLDDAALTAERFGLGGFRTGDLGRYLPDGRIEFLGSPDRHLNLGGFRLHLGELEAALLRHSAVKASAAVPSESLSSDQRPVVYVEIDPYAAGPASPQRDASLRRQLRAALKESCPDYPQPLRILFLDKLPLNPGGRVDRRALPPVDLSTSELDSSVIPPRDALESQLVEIWEELLGVRPIGITDNFFDLHGHSLLALRLFTRVNSIWGKNLPLSTLFQAPTVEGLAEILRRDGWSPSSSSLVAIQPQGSNLPLYIISGLGGNVVRFRDLARHLGPDQPIYALQPPGMDGSQPYLTRLEDMAAHYIREIKANQPSGPYHLAGYSFGGLVTFEMGRQLGEEAGLLALLDAPEWHYMGQTVKAMSVRDKLRRAQVRIKTILFGPERLEYLRDRIRQHTSRIVYSLSKALGLPLPQSFGTLSDINSFAATHYVPQVYAGRLTLLRTSPHARVSQHDYQLGWGALAAGGVEVHEIPGDHSDITSEPNVRILAQKLRLILDKVQPCLSDSSTRIAKDSQEVSESTCAESPSLPQAQFSSLPDRARGVWQT